MSFGGIHPAEWILPAVGFTHAFVNSTQEPTKQRKAAERLIQEEKKQQLLSEQKAKESAPFTSEQELASRQRLASAAEFLTGEKRTIRTLGAA